MSYSVIIPSKTASNLVACIQAIRQAGETCRIIVVDDGIEWSEVEIYARATYPADRRYGGTPIAWLPFDIIQGADPFVFSRNVNLGIQAAGDVDVIVMNDDALLKTPYGFRLLSAASKAWRDCGLIAAACNTVGNPNQFRRRESGGREEPRMVCFVCVYIPRSTIHTVGLLDERFVGYGMDDDDYSLRVRNAELKLVIFDGCYVDHGSLRSTFRGGPQTGGDFRPNMKLFIEKWNVDNWGRDRAHSEFADLFPKAAR